jgi:hypothetical protein
MIVLSTIVSSLDHLTEKVAEKYRSIREDMHEKAFFIVTGTSNGMFVSAKKRGRQGRHVTVL